MNNEKVVLMKRIFIGFLGTVVCGVCVAFFRQAALGVDPFSSLPSGIYLVFGSYVSYGMIYLILNLIMFFFMVIFARKYIGINTFINMTLLGYVTEFTERILVSFIASPTMGVRVFYMLFGVVVCCLGAAMTITANVGLSAYDWIGIVIAEKIKKIHFKYIRIMNDFFCVVIGFICGYKPGVGTILMAFGTGPLISFYRYYLIEPFIYGKRITK